MADKKYKLIARGGSAMQRCRLYRADDHLLHVTGTYIEEYRKFYYSDIRGALIQENKKKSWIAALSIALFIAISVLLFTIGDSPAVPLGIFCSIIAAILVLYLAPTLVSGGFASLYIVTSVQHGRVAAVKSRRKARKVVGIIQQQLKLNQPTQANTIPPAPQPEAS